MSLQPIGISALLRHVATGFNFQASAGQQRVHVPRGAHACAARYLTRVWTDALGWKTWHGAQVPRSGARVWGSGVRSATALNCTAVCVRVRVCVCVCVCATVKGTVCRATAITCTVVPHSCEKSRVKGEEREVIEI